MALSCGLLYSGHPVFSPSFSWLNTFQEIQSKLLVPMICMKKIPFSIPRACKMCFAGEQEGSHIRWVTLLYKKGNIIRCTWYDCWHFLLFAKIYDVYHMRPNNYPRARTRKWVELMQLTKEKFKYLLTGGQSTITIFCLIVRQLHCIAMSVGIL